jgi:hypothetical protein
MPRLTLTYDALQVLLYHHVLVEVANGSCDKQLQRWASLSAYNRSILDDIHNDAKLRHELVNAYYTDSAQFWKVLLTYRAAMHPHMPALQGNFWQRMFRQMGMMFQKQI